jgi:hypothetical protein
MFTFKKNEIKNLADFKTAAPELHDALVAEATAPYVAQVGQLTEEIAKFNLNETKKAEHEKIRNYAKKMNKTIVGEQCIDQDMGFNEACVALIEGAVDPLIPTDLDEDNQDGADAVNDFLGSSSKSAGIGGSKDVGDEPKTFADAINLISARDSITKAEASKKARTEFESLFNKQYQGR